MQGLCLKDNQNEAPRKAYGNCKLRIIKVTIDYLVQLSIALHLALHLQASNRDKKVSRRVFHNQIHPTFSFFSPPSAKMLQQLHFGNIVARAALSCVSSGRISRLLHTVHCATREHLSVLCVASLNCCNSPNVALAPIRCSSRTTITESGKHPQKHSKPKQHIIK